MKLYYSAGSCSTSCHISLEESGLKYQTVAVDWDNPSDPHAAEIPKMNGMGTLPILVTDDNKQLDQNLSIHMYIADKAPGKNLLPASGIERYQAMNWLSFVAADLHKSVGANGRLYQHIHQSVQRSVQHKTCSKMVWEKRGQEIHFALLQSNRLPHRQKNYQQRFECCVQSFSQ